MGPMLQVNTAIFRPQIKETYAGKWEEHLQKDRDRQRLRRQLQQEKIKNARQNDDLSNIIPIDVDASIYRLSR